ncbi:SAV_2336 N-terminal domain-related protein [Streptomyces sp. NPDC002577]
MNAAPGLASDAVRDTLTALVARLREADLPVTAEGVADALWLARWVSPAAPGTAPAQRGGQATPLPPASPHAVAESDAEDAPLPPRPDSPKGAGPASSEGRAGLSAPGGTGAPGTGDGENAQVWVPTAATLPDPHVLQRALRPLQRFRAPSAPVRGVLDEVATADLAARTGLSLPVLRPSRRPQARIRLLMDVSSSMVVWDQTLDELRTVCERSGAFREVRTDYLHEQADGTPGVAGSLTRGSAPLRPPGQFADPTGVQLTVVLSDCAGPLWRSGQLHRTLHRWAATAPVAVLQPLPLRMWRNTHLPAAPGMLRRPEGPAGRMEFRSASRPPGQATPVPVLAPSEVALSTWARLLAGAGELSLPAAAGWVTPDRRPARMPVAAGEPPGAAELVSAFRRHASPSAVRLAECLSLVPLILPVMQVVQRAMLVGSGPDVLAEVLLSGLLRRSTEPSEEPAYEFVQGVQEELWQRLAPGDVHLVLKNCSQYLERRFGRTARNFPAMAAAYLAGTVDAPGAPSDSREDPRLRRFAVVSTQVLRRFLAPPADVAPTGAVVTGPGDLAEQGRARLERFRTQGTSRDLDAAVQLLTAALRAERRRDERADLAAELAEALWERWEARRLGEDLKDALATAEQAVPHVAGAYWTLGRALEAMAREVRSAGAATDAVPDRFRETAARRMEGGGQDPEALRFLLLVSADEALAQVPQNGTAVQQRAAVVRAEVLQQLAADYAGYAAVLHDPPPSGPDEWYAARTEAAIEVLDSLVAADPTPATRYLRGRLAYRLAQRTGLSPHGDRARVRSIAAGATRDLLEALDWAEVQEPGLRGAVGHFDAESLRHLDLGPQALCLGWIEAADAALLAYDEESEGTGEQIALYALGRARRIAETHEPWEDRNQALADCLVRTGSLRVKLLDPADPDDLAETAAVLAEAMRLLPRDSAGRITVLTAYGNVLLLGEPGRDDVDRAVRIFREAVDGTPGTSPDLPQYRLHLGSALLRRYRMSGALTDLHEADWILGAAARGTASRALSAMAWTLCGEAAAALAEATGATGRLSEAADHYRRAVEDALAAESVELAVQALAKRAAVLEQTAGPARALVEYHAALQLLEENGQDDTEEAARLRETARRLEAGGV